MKVKGVRFEQTNLTERRSEIIYTELQPRTITIYKSFHKDTTSVLQPEKLISISPVPVNYTPFYSYQNIQFLEYQKVSET